MKDAPIYGLEHHRSGRFFCCAPLGVNDEGRQNLAAVSLAVNSPNRCSRDREKGRPKEFVPRKKKYSPSF